MAETCTVCNGTGEVLNTDNQPVVCEHCNGTGEDPVQDPQQTGGGGG